MGLFTQVILGTLLLLILLRVAKYLNNYLQYRKKLNKLPQSECNFLLGHAWEMLVPPNQLIEAGRKVIASSPSLCVLWFGPVPVVSVYNPEHAEVILGSSQYIDKPFVYSFLHPWLGTGLLTSTGSKWHSRRKMLTPAFHFTILENFVEVFAKKSQILVRKLQKEIGSQHFNIYPYITNCALDIICETAMGTEVNAQDQDNQMDYVKAVSKSVHYLTKRILSPWFYIDSSFNLSPLGRKFYKNVNIMHSFSKKVIQERRQLYNNLKKSETSLEGSYLGRRKKITFLDILLESSQKEKLTDEDIREEVDTFMFEGHDTTAAAMSWALYLLSRHPDVQDKAFEELESIFQGSDRAPTIKDLNEMKYLDRVIKETLRLYPSVPFIERCHKHDIEIDGQTIPKNTIISIAIYFIHRLPEYYPDPEKFNPDNFLPERVVDRHPYAYIPFSAGPRNCIGQKFALLEEKTILSYILRNYKLHAVGSIPKPVPELVLKPDIGIPIQITSRRNLT